MGSEVFIRKASGVTREISALDALILGIVILGLLHSVDLYNWDAAAFMGADLSLAFFIAFFLIIPQALYYWFMSVAFPREGGAYVWVSRMIHPALGFANSFLLGINTAVFFGLWAGYVSWGLGTFFSLAAIRFNIPVLLGYAEWAFSTSGHAIITFVYIFFIYLICVNLKVGKILQYITCISTVTAVLLISGLFLATPREAFANAFNTAVQGQTSYQAIISAAYREGMVLNPAFTISFVFFAALMIYQGYQWGSFYAGEVKHVEKSIPIAILGSMLVGMVIFSGVNWIMANQLGREFLFAGCYLNVNAPQVAEFAPLTRFPVLHLFYTNALLPRTAIGDTVAFIIFFSAAGIIPFMGLFNFLLIFSRQVFAWSFDRIFPVRFADIDTVLGWRGPFKALSLALIVSLAGAAFTFALPGLIAGGLNWTLALAVDMVLPGIAGIVFPFLKKDLWQSSPKIVRIKIGPVPLISIVGLGTALLGAYGAYYIATNPFTGVFGWQSMVGIFIVGLIIYYISRYVRKKQGIPMELSFKEIPPD